MFSELFYLLFLACVVIVFAFAPQSYRAAILAISGIAFYAHYGGAYCWLLLALTLCSWLVFFALPERKTEGKPDLAALLIALSIPLFALVLAYFKYSSFLVQIFFGGPEKRITAPLAISFFIFEFIHVAVERSKGSIKRIDFFDYFAFIFFFPTMVAGPIKRFGVFKETLETAQVTPNNLLEGLVRICVGLFKKLVIADNLNSVIQLIGGPQQTHNVALLLGAIFLYGFRILFDFAGYSDIAIGSARLFGIKVPENFLRPYRQPDITSFWRNWHVSLYTWLMDYVYIPLGGGKVPYWRKLCNIMTVMFLSGIWHGAAWNFIVWGIWHGSMLVIHRVYSDKVIPKMPPKVAHSIVAKSVGYAGTMVGVWMGWMLFMWSIEDCLRFVSLLADKMHL